MSSLLILLRKEFIQELRSREVLAIMLAMSLLLSVLSAVGVQLSFMDGAQVQKVAPLLIWLSFLFAATSALGRSFDCELQHGAIDGLKLSGVSFSVVYLAKVIASAATLFFCQCVSATVLLVLLDLSAPAQWGYFIVLSLIVVVAYTALAVLFSAVAAVSKLKGLILPLILFPLLFPIFIAAVETTNQLMLDQTFYPTSFWFSLSGVLLILYLALGINLYQYVVEE